MKNKLIFLILSLFVFLPIAKADTVDIHLFYSELCSTCKAEEEYLEEYAKNNDVNIIKYEVTRNEDNANLLSEVRAALKNKELTTPYTVIGTTGITGFSDTVKNQIDAAVKKYSDINYVDIVYNIKNNIEEEYTIYPPEGEYNIPILGNINPKNVSLPIVAMIIGFIDGFNPCAMWILLFLISMLLNMKNRKRMWIIGITFLVTSALVYLAFMLAWLKIAITLTQISWVRLIIGLIALICATISITSYIESRKKENGCQVVDDKKRKDIFKKIKKIISSVDEKGNLKGFIIALLGIMGLAISVNMIELACSSGLPLIFTQILAINELSSIQYFIYILIYIIFFLIDDLMIFIVAMTTLKLTGISTKYSKLSHLIGGIVMLLIGILMIFKPEWLMFKF